MSEQFIPYGPVWKDYKQSDLLKPWSDSAREKVRYTTGIDFPEGTKGFPFKLLEHLFKLSPYLLEDIFKHTEVSQKGILSAKGYGKSRLGHILQIFFQVNFDNAHIIGMMKYQIDLFKFLDGMVFYLNQIELECGISFMKCFVIPDDLNVKTADIHIKRRWSKTHFTRWRLRSFDKPNKLSGIIPRHGVISFVWIEEPVMFNDPNDVSAEMFFEIWSNMKSSIFRWAKLNKLYVQLFTSMNGWDEHHDFVESANELLPFDIDRIKEEETYFGVFEDHNWLWRRASRYANKAIPVDEDEARDVEILKEQNYNLYIAQVLGGTYDFAENMTYTHRAHMMNVRTNVDTPGKNLMTKDKGYMLELGLDWGTNHATTLKASHWIPSEVRLHRESIARVCNMERKKEKLTQLDASEIMDQMAEGVLEYILPYLKFGVISYLWLGIDGGSSTMVSLFETMFKNYGLSDVIRVYATKRHGKDGIKAKTLWDQKYHSKGMIEYNSNNQVTFDQYYNCKNMKNNAEVRDEKQLLDELDGTNCAEENIRMAVDSFMYNRRYKDVTEQEGVKYE